MASKNIPSRSARKKKVAEVDITDEFLSVKEPLQIREINWTAKQRNVIETTLDNNNKIIFLNGKAGSGKSTLAIYCALQLLKEKAVNKIIIIRTPVESCQHKIGYLPSGLIEKMSPYMKFGDDIMLSFISKIELECLKNNGTISILPTGFLRGLSFHNTCVLVEEASDFSTEDFELVMGRFGRNSKLILAGDPRQSSVRSSGFQSVYNIFDSEECRAKGIHCFKFEISDCLRSPLTKFILEKFEKLNP